LVSLTRPTAALQPRSPAGLRNVWFRPLSEAQTGHRSPLPLRYTMRAPGSPPVARLVRTTSERLAARPRPARRSQSRGSGSARATVGRACCRPWECPS
jgi:hypothetical protein